jgi:Spy/CpxP family protein refolding chaperone
LAGSEKTSRRTVIAAALVVALAFAAGVATGFIGDRIYLMTHERIIPRGGIVWFGRHLIQRLDRSLDLTDGQKAQIEEIIDRRTQRMLASTDSVHQALHAEFEATHAEIEKVLTPEQREKFQRMQKRWHHRKR